MGDSPKHQRIILTHMVIKYIDQSVNKLNYIFIAGNINVKDYFKVIRQREYSHNIGRLKVYIVGESHVIEFCNGKARFTEILASINNSELNGLSLERIPIIGMRGGSKPAYVYKNDHFEYSFVINKEKCSRSKVLKILSGVRSRPADEVLLFEWNEEKRNGDDTELPSFTCIKHKFSKASFGRIDTLHFYKKEEILVSSRSIYKNSLMGLSK